MFVTLNHSELTTKRLRSRELDIVFLFNPINAIKTPKTLNLNMLKKAKLHF